MFYDCINWEEVSRKEILDEETLTRFKDKVVWSIIEKNQTLSISCILKFRNRLNLKKMNQILTPKFAEEFKNQIDFCNVKYDSFFLIKFREKFDSFFSKIDNQFTKEFFNEDFIFCQKFDEDFLIQLRNKINLKEVIIDQKVSMNFIEEFKQFLSSSCYQKLPESFFIKYRRKVYWENISKLKMSNHFIQEFIDQLEIETVLDYHKNLSLETKVKLLEELRFQPKECNHYCYCGRIYN